MGLIDTMSVSDKLYVCQTNVIRDQLTKAGFDVTVSLQPDYGSMFAQVDARNYDINIGTFRVLPGNPDYGCRSMFYSTGCENYSKVEDPEVDRLIDLGASQLPQDYQETYAELERLLVEGKAYFAPICRTMSCYGFNKNVIKEDTVTIGQSKYLYWSQLDYVDESLRETRPLIIANERVLGQFDPATVDGTHRVMANTNINLVQIDDQDNIVTDGALAYNYSIAEGNSVFYFVLRDNVGFYTAKNGELVETPEKTNIWAWKHPHEDGTTTYTQVRGDVRFFDVDFGYNPDKIVLHDITLYAEPGQKVRRCNRRGQNDHHQPDQPFLRPRRRQDPLRRHQYQ